MSTIKQDRVDLERMLNGISGDSQPQQPVQPSVQAPSPAGLVDNSAGDSFGVEKQFSFDYEGTKKGLRKKARKTVNNIIKHILTNDMCEEEYVKDKLEQDIDVLCDLYMQLESNNVMQRSILENVARGNTMPRMYEVFGQLSDKISSINKQIIATEQTIRKTYLDLKFEINDKRAEVGDLGMQQNALEAPKQQGNLVTSTKQLIEQARAKHRKQIEEAKEAEFTEEK